jgi:steroid delta-isomerase-like uncharacterized protein
MANREIVRAYFAAWNAGKLNAALFHPEFRRHDTTYPMESPLTLADLQACIDEFRTAFTDPKIEILSEGGNEIMVEEGERVMLRYKFTGRHTGRFMGIAPTGHTIEVLGMALFRFVKGEIAEYCSSADDLGMLRQLGLTIP